MDIDDRQVLRDGCDGDSVGLTAALGEGAKLIYQNNDNQGWGHHSYDEIYELADGRQIHASCAGCSCHGSGNWDYVEPDKAMQYVPEDKR